MKYFQGGVTDQLYHVKRFSKLIGCTVFLIGQSLSSGARMFDPGHRKISQLITDLFGLSEIEQFRMRSGIKLGWSELRLV